MWVYIPSFPYIGGRQWQHYEVQIGHQPGVTVVTDGSSSGLGSTGCGQRRQELRITTQGQTSHSLPTQTSPPLRGVLAVTKNPLPQAHSVLNRPELHGADVDYDMLSPVDTNEPTPPRIQRDRLGAFNVSDGATSRSEETLMTLLHCDPRPPKLSTTRKNTTGCAPLATGKQQNNRVRSPSGLSSSSSIPVPILKRINSGKESYLYWWLLKILPGTDPEFAGGGRGLW